jgi:hypothetical protein
VRGARVGLVLVILAIGALVLIVPQLLGPTLATPLWFRVLVTIGLLLPLGILMGFPLPLGIRALEGGRAVLIPWAWGLNGAASVLASVLAVALGMYAGFTVATLAGAACYGLALLAAGRLPATTKAPLPPAPPSGAAPLAPPTPAPSPEPRGTAGGPPISGPPPGSP